jgi:hypothetical protein
MQNQPIYYNFSKFLIKFVQYFIGFPGVLFRSAHYFEPRRNKKTGSLFKQT